MTLPNLPLLSFAQYSALRIMNMGDTSAAVSKARSTALPSGLQIGISRLTVSWGMAANQGPGAIAAAHRVRLDSLWRRLGVCIDQGLRYLQLPQRSRGDPRLQSAFLYGFGTYASRSIVYAPDHRRSRVYRCQCHGGAGLILVPLGLGAGAVRIRPGGSSPLPYRESQPTALRKLLKPACAIRRRRRPESTSTSTAMYNATHTRAPTICAHACARRGHVHTSSSHDPGGPEFLGTQQHRREKHPLEKASL